MQSWLVWLGFFVLYLLSLLWFSCTLWIFKSSLSWMASFFSSSVLFSLFFALDLRRSTVWCKGSDICCRTHEKQTWQFFQIKKSNRKSVDSRPVWATDQKYEENNCYTFPNLFESSDHRNTIILFLILFLLFQLFYIKHLLKITFLMLFSSFILCFFVIIYLCPLTSVE